MWKGKVFKYECLPALCSRGEIVILNLVASLVNIYSASLPAVPDIIIIIIII